MGTPSRSKRRSGSLESLKTPVTARLETTPSPRQRETGEKIRRKHRDEKNKEIDSLNEKIEESGRIIEERNAIIKELKAKLEKAANKNEELQTKVDKNDDWVKPVYKNLNSD